MKKKEIKDTYRLGNNSEDLQVNDVYVDNNDNMIYAATVQGVRYADQSDNLSDFNSWSRMNFLPVSDGIYNHINFWAGKLFVNYYTGTFDEDVVYTIVDTIVDTFEVASFSATTDFQVESDRLIISKYSNVLTYDENLNSLGVLFQYDVNLGMTPNMTIHLNNLYWIADRFLGLARYETVGAVRIIAPNGPNTLSINDADAVNSVVSTTSGILDPDYRGSGNAAEFNRYENFEWKGMNVLTHSELDSVYGYIKTIINPSDEAQVFMASWDNGLMELNNGDIVQSYTMATKAATGTFTYSCRWHG